MARVARCLDANREPIGWIIECPACRYGHRFDHRWTFNGDVDQPTFSPSLLIRTSQGVCHSYVQDGRIQFLGDCTHALAGQTVELPDLGRAEIPHVERNVFGENLHQPG